MTKETREMAKGRDNDQVMGRGAPGETEVGPLGQGQRWTAARKREVVLRLFRGEPLDLVSRELGVELYRLEQWREDALAGMEEALKARRRPPQGRTGHGHAAHRRAHHGERTVMGPGEAPRPFS